MKRCLLSLAVLLGTTYTAAATAQDFDDRWYVTAGAGYNDQDDSRHMSAAPFGALGVGKYLNRNWSIDAELNYQNPNDDGSDNYNWSQYGISADFRYHLISEGRSWHPYLLMGVGVQRSEEEYPAGSYQLDRYTSTMPLAEQKTHNAAAKIGAGIQSDFARFSVRGELAYRADFNNESQWAYLEDDKPLDDGKDWFGDALASVAIVVPLGAASSSAAPAPAAAPNCADGDDDGDGVNNCDDKCPGSQAGQTIGPDGCPVPVSIDLKGVNFDFDKSTLRPDAVQILGEAVEIFKRYPELKAEVAGHTDQCGSDAYNQGLSERRARAVYDYLTSNGIDAARLTGPNGYGESRPLEDLGQTVPGCKSERNRRTELNVQN